VGVALPVGPLGPATGTNITVTTTGPDGGDVHSRRTRPSSGPLRPWANQLLPETMLMSFCSAERKSDIPKGLL
jgi:hypothetical protein